MCPVEDARFGRIAGWKIKEFDAAPPAPSHSGKHIIPKSWPKVEKSKSELGTFSQVNYS
jgi:hypothetical protein